MIRHGAYPTEPWSVSETALDLNVLAQSESLFALSNGHIGLRGNLDEGEPYGIPGTYLNGFYEKKPQPYAEAGYGFPETDQTLVDVANGKLVRLLVDDAPLDVRYGDLHDHHRRLDLRSGMLERTVDWSSAAQTRVRVRSRRLVSFSQRAIAAIEYVVEPVGSAARITVQSELVANEQQPGSPPTRVSQRCSGTLWRRSRKTATTALSCCCTGRERASCSWARAWATSSRHPAGWRPRWS